MKKILMFVLCLFPVCAVYAANGMSGYAELGGMMQIKSTPVARMSGGVSKTTGCGLNQITLFGLNQFPSDDEFLFDSMQAFESAPKNNGNGTYNIDGMVWECDNEYCGHDFEKQMEPGHVFMGEVVNESRLYRCVTNGLRQSHWEYEIEENLCGETHISFDGQQPDDNEFLYETETAFNSVKNRPDGGTVAGGRVFECDNKHCPGATEMPMPAGHVFMGKVVNEEAIYICNSQSLWKQFDDRWERLFDGCVYKGQHINLNDWYADSDGKKIIVNYAECSQWQDMNPADEKKSFHARCEMVGGTKTLQCYPIGDDGKKPEKPDDDDKKPGDDDKRDDSNGGDDKVNKKQQNCIKSWGTWKNGQCVCEEFKNLKHENGICVCKDKNYIRDGASKTCKPADGEKEKSECEAASDSGAYWDNGECKCRDIRKDFVGGKCTEKADIQKCNRIEGAEWSDSLGKCVCKDSANMEFNENKTACVVKEEVAKKRDAEALIVRVKETHQKLQKRQAEMKVSVWKDAEGNFNTARLVSDSVAGVVLGTAGGLITSSVVKKNQVENGFEDLKCTVGGQIVADWGDQFRVGIQ